MPETTYRRNAAGAHMTTRIPKVLPSETIGGVQSLLHKYSRSFDTINYIYVTDAAGTLIGALSIRELYHHEPNVRIGDVCTKNHLIVLPPDARQERAAYLSLKHAIKAIPIVNKNNVFLGVISSDDLLAILYRKTHEDLMRSIGAHGLEAPPIDNVLKISPWKSVRHRIPWLFFGLLGGLLAARIIGSFEATLQKNLVLASFIPLIVYMSDAVGTQMEAFIIRDLALDRHLHFRKYFFRQFSTVFSMALLFGFLLFAGATLFFHSGVLGATLGISLALAILSSVLSGLATPFLFSRLNMDPANASGPIATIVQDIVSVSVYFTVASLLL